MSQADTQLDEDMFGEASPLPAPPTPEPSGEEPLPKTLDPKTLEGELEKVIDESLKSLNNDEALKKEESTPEAKAPKKTRSSAAKTAAPAEGKRIRGKTKAKAPAEDEEEELEFDADMATMNMTGQ